jgi:hypothetical protein
MLAFAMHARRHHTASRCRLVWLLWIALFLPIAQAAASWHAMSHVSLEAASEPDGRQALHLSHCDLCLAGAALTGAASLGEPDSPAHSVARFGRPQHGAADLWHASPALAYRSRAPPFVLS